MRKLLRLSKTLLVAAGLLVGVNSAWADDWSVDFATIAKSGTDKQSVTISESVVTIDGIAMGTASLGSTAINANVVFQTGTTWLGRTAGRFQHSDGSGKSFGIRNCTQNQTITISTGNTTINSAYNATLQSSDNGVYVYKVTNDGDVKFAHARYIYLYSIDVKDPSASAVNYTVKYQDGEGNTLKDDAIHTGNPGETPTISSVDKAYITKDEKRYVYSSDNASSLTINADGSTVVIITFREANSYTYSIKAVDESDKDLFTIGSGTYTEGDAAVSVPYPRFYLSGTNLLASGNGTFTYATNFTPDENDYVHKVVYNAGTVDNVAFFIEGEDVEGATIGANAARASKGQMGHTGGSETYLNVTTLAPGKYVIRMRGQNGNNAERNFNFKVGDKVVFNGKFGNGTNMDLDSEEFTVTTASTLSFACEGSSASGIDYFFLHKTAVPATITAAGWSTLYTDYALDFSGVDGLTAYTATCDGSKVTLTEVENVPAGTGVVLKGAANTYNIPVIASSATAKGDLKGSTTEAKAYDTANNYYYLALNGEEAQFKKLAEGGSIAAGKAYLQLSIGGAPSLNIDLGGTTGINAVQGSAFTVNGEYYNLAGQRVTQPTKGLYIVNGKKVVVK